MRGCLVILLTILFHVHIFVPVNLDDRHDISKIQLTNIGHFGIIRKARKNIPRHYHTGIDIKRPRKNYSSEPIFPIAKGRVISKRTDGPFANIIIEHETDRRKFWTLYEHVSGIKVRVNDIVNPDIAIARFMNKEELNRYGWQFDHFHLEILKIKPTALKPDNIHSERFFNSYSLLCYTINDLHRYYFDPIEFFEENK